MFINTEALADLLSKTPSGQTKADAGTLAQGKALAGDLLKRTDELRDVLARTLETFNDPDTSNVQLFRVCCDMLNVLESPEWNNVKNTTTMTVPSCKTWDRMEEKHWQQIEKHMRGYATYINKLTADISVYIAAIAERDAEKAHVAAHQLLSHMSPPQSPSVSNLDD